MLCKVPVKTWLLSYFFTATWVLSFQEDGVGVRLRDVIGVDNDAGPRLPAQRIDASS